MLEGVVATALPETCWFLNTDTCNEAVASLINASRPHIRLVREATVYIIFESNYKVMHRRQTGTRYRPGRL